MFSFNLHREFAPSSAGERELKHLLRGVHGVDAALIQLVNITASEMVSRGAAANEFVRWCRDNPGAHPLQRLDRSFLENLFTAVALRHYRDERTKQQADPEIAFVFPFREFFWIGPEACPKHRGLDGFIARAEDEAWERILPNAAPVCGCILTSLLDEDVPLDSPGRLPGIPRLPRLS